MNSQLSRDNSWMVAYVTRNQTEAHIVTGRLKFEGIAAFIAQEPIGNIYGGLLAGALGEIKVCVSAKDYDRALEILAIDESDIAYDDDDQGELDVGDDE